MGRTAIYARVSSEQQREEHDRKPDGVAAPLRRHPKNGVDHL